MKAAGGGGSQPGMHVYVCSRTLRQEDHPDVTLTDEPEMVYASNFIIQRLGTVQGARVPQPWGGKWPQVMIDLDQDEQYARGLSPQNPRTLVPMLRRGNEVSMPRA